MNRNNSIKKIRKDRVLDPKTRTKKTIKIGAMKYNKYIAIGYIYDKNTHSLILPKKQPMTNIDKNVVDTKEDKNNDDLSEYGTDDEDERIKSASENESDEESDNSDTTQTQSSNEIYFDDPDTLYGKLSNSYIIPQKLLIHDKKYPSVEHWFQSSKFSSFSDPYSKQFGEQIRTAKNANHAKILALQKVGGVNKKWRKKLNILILESQKFKVQPRNDWDVIKDDIMLEGLREKFTQDKSCQDVLLSTDNKQLISHTKFDKYWGDGGDGSGKNKLGQFLMKVRDTMKTQKPPIIIDDDNNNSDDLSSQSDDEQLSENEISTTPQQEEPKEPEEKEEYINQYEKTEFKEEYKSPKNQPRSPHPPIQDMKQKISKLKSNNLNTLKTITDLEHQINKTQKPILLAFRSRSRSKSRSVSRSRSRSMSPKNINNYNYDNNKQLHNMYLQPSDHVSLYYNKIRQMPRRHPSIKMLEMLYNSY